MLIPVATKGALDAAEADNLMTAIAWVNSRRLTSDVVINEQFLRDLHRRMFGGVWGWAGTYRRSDKNIGVPWFEVPIQMRLLLDDAVEWLATTMDADHAAVAFGHRLVRIHAFPNGNGRHSRLASDCLANALGRPVFTWRGAGIGPPGSARDSYLAAVRAADAGDIEPLLAFARS